MAICRKCGTWRVIICGNGLCPVCDARETSKVKIRDEHSVRAVPEIDPSIFDGPFITMPRQSGKSMFEFRKMIDAMIFVDSKFSTPTPDIKDVIFNGPATIVLWKDGTKTVVKAQDGEPVDKEKGLAIAIAKKVYGNKGSYYNIFKKWVK